MAQKYAYLRIGGADCIELRNKMVELEIYDEQVKIGTLSIGKVGVKWLPKRKHRGRGGERVITWEDLGAT
jgi:hypothetical protein